VQLVGGVGLPGVQIEATRLTTDLAEATGATPPDRGTCGTKRHLLTDGAGVPLAVVVTGANRTDRKTLGDLLDAQLLPRPLEPDPADPTAGPQRCLDRGDAAAACRETAVGHGYSAHLPPKRSAEQPPPRRGTPPATRRAAGWWRPATAGSTASAACSCAGRSRRPTTWASSTSPPAASSTANSAALAPAWWTIR